VKKLAGQIKGWVGRYSTLQIGFCLAAIVLILDQLTKNWILYLFDLPAKYSVQVLPFFRLSMVWNDGVSFGLFSAETWVGRLLLVSFSLLVVGLLVKWLLETDRKLFAMAVGMVIGGAIGNALDRLIYGAVVDFLDFSQLYFQYVFNVADAAISIGVVLLVYDAFFAKQDQDQPVDSLKSDNEPQ
jgi:signal peptidase II